ncbi:MAG TPA: 50S ribosomal protein L16 [Thermotogota bacterium]|nr:50S ribosomal protein L16 [Thermotogota bacterium]HRW91369.1 50S ribosomal protein L16 [Thermotogota bacterium]
MLMPKRVKYRKQQRGTMAGKAKGGTEVHFGEWGLKALEPRWITARQIEACRVVMVRTLKRSGKVLIRVFPDKPITKRAQDSRMGKGKGNVDMWVSVVKPGKILFEIAGVPDQIAKTALKNAAAKLPIETKIVPRHTVGGE